MLKENIELINSETHSLWEEIHDSLMIYGATHINLVRISECFPCDNKDIMNTCCSHLISYLEISEFKTLRQKRKKITKVQGDFCIKIQY